MSVVWLALAPAAARAAVQASFQDGVSGYTGTQDTYLYGQQPSSNFGTATSFALFEREVNTTNFVREMMRFDLSSILPTTPVYSATLTLTTLPYAFDATGVTNSLFIVDPVDGAWTESSATWNNAVQSTPQAWAGGPGLVAGADYNASAVASVATPNTTLAQQAGGVQMTFVLNGAGLTALEGWINDPSSNTGFFMRQPSGTHSVDQFYSSEAATVGFHPLLTLSIPEPASLGLFGAAGALILRRRVLR